MEQRRSFLPITSPIEAPRRAQQLHADHTLRRRGARVWSGTTSSSAERPDGVTMLKNQHAGEPALLGLNVAWHDFGGDVGWKWDAGWFKRCFARLRDAGGNAVRVWVHADGRRSPKFHGRRVVGMGHTTFERDLLELVALAARYGHVLQLCLWSFDMCQQDAPGLGRRADLIKDAKLTRSYVDNALVPMLRVLNAAPGGAPHVTIEVINEPEWCVKNHDCSTAEHGGECVSLLAMQRFVGLIAEAVGTAGRTFCHGPRARSATLTDGVHSPTGPQLHCSAGYGRLSLLQVPRPRPARRADWPRQERRHDQLALARRGSPRRTSDSL